MIFCVEGRLIGIVRYGASTRVAMVSAASGETPRSSAHAAKIMHIASDGGIMAAWMVRPHPRLRNFKFAAGS